MVKRGEKCILHLQVMEIKAEGVARCNEMYTTSYPSIIYTRHCKYSKNIDVIEDIYYYYYHYSNRECDGAIGCSCSQVVCNATQYRLTRLYMWICGFVSRMVFFYKMSPFVLLYFRRSLEFARNQFPKTLICCNRILVTTFYLVYNKK